MSLCVFLSHSVWHHCSPPLPIVPVALQPQATQALSNSRRHTMQTADQNRMDMCRPRLALIPGHTLKIESENSGNGMALRNVTPAPECRITCKEEKVAVFVHSLSVCACIHFSVCVWPSGDMAVTKAHPWRALCPPSMPHVSHCKLPLSQLLRESLATIATYCKWTSRQLGYDMSCCVFTGNRGSLKIYSHKSSQLETRTIKSYLWVWTRHSTTEHRSAAKLIRINPLKCVFYFD